MDPITLANLGLFALQEAIKLEPAIAAELQKLFAKGDPTEQDWADLRASITAKSYRDYVPATAIPAGDTAAAPVSAPTGATATPAAAPALALPAAAAPPAATPVAVLEVAVAKALAALPDHARC